MIALMHVNPGFVAQDLTTFPFTLPPARYASASDRVELYRRLVEEVDALPRVQAAALVSHLPFSGAFRFMHVCPEGAVCEGLGKDPIVMWLQVSPDYFQTMRLHLLQGRAFDARDRAESQPVVIIPKTLADRYFKGTDPIGRHIVVSRDKLAMEIVGVAADSKFTALNAPNAEAILVPYTQNPWPSMNLLVRSTEKAPVAEVRRIFSRIDSDLPVSNVQGMDTLVSGSLAQPRLLAGLVGAFALAALLLAAIGIYGVMAYLVSQRSAEMAIRSALGAQKWMVFRLVVGEGLKLVAVGIGMGSIMAFTMERLIASLLFATSPNDWITFAAVAGLLVAVALGACYFPARRAMGLDPVRVLRNT
jgi:putative ABC transport system permease protein